MTPRYVWLLWILAALPAMSGAQSAFDGVWRPDPQRGDPKEKPDVYTLADGVYGCTSCSPPYSVKVDGTDQPVKGNPRYDTLNVRVIDAHSLMKIAKMKGQTVMDTHVAVSPDGGTLTEKQRLYGMGPNPVELTSTSTRLSSQSEHGHLISGTWRRIETDLTNHDEDTTFRITDGVLSMSDKMGRSFHAKLDGTDAPYGGSTEFTSVSVKLLNSSIIEESDKMNGQVVKICRWTLDPDGRTIHVRFDDTHGHIQQQTGHRIAPPAQR